MRQSSSSSWTVRSRDAAAVGRDRSVSSVGLVGELESLGSVDEQRIVEQIDEDVVELGLLRDGSVRQTLNPANRDRRRRDSDGG